LAVVSLNRTEQLVFDYLRKHAEEGQHWQGKVRALAARHATDVHAAAVALEGELWRYYEERSRVAAPFRERTRLEGLRRTSMRNLADHLLRLWISPRPERPTPDKNTMEGGKPDIFETFSSPSRLRPRSNPFPPSGEGLG